MMTGIPRHIDMRTFLASQVQYLRRRFGPRVLLLMRGPETHHQPEQNIWHLYQDILWIGLTGAATTFTNIYAIRLGASDTLIALLSSLPSLFVILLRLPAAQLVEGSSNPVRLISSSLLGTRSFYLLLGLLPFLRLAHESAVFVALVILMGLPAVLANAGWDTLFAEVVPQRDRATVVGMRNTLASIIGVIVVLVGGKWLDWVPFPWNYQSIFLLAFAGAMVSTHHVSRIEIPRSSRERQDRGRLRWEDVRSFLSGGTGFGALTAATFVYTFAMTLPSPLYSIYFVKYLQASDGWIGLRSTILSLTPILAYRLWPKLVQHWGDRAVLLLCAPLTVILPLGTGLFQSLLPQLFVVAWMGLVGPGAELARYNMLLRLCPPGRRPMAIGVFAIIANVATFVAPLLGAQLVGIAGIRYVFFLSAGIRLVGALLFRRVPSDPEGPSLSVSRRLATRRT
jgi:MFS family permease